MKSSKAGSCKAASSLPESIHEHLNMYAIAAGAAGVGILALAQPAEAKIVYTPANVKIVVNHQYNLDLNHDGVTDFTIENPFRFHIDRLYASAAAGNGVVGGKNGWAGWAAALDRGAQIGSVQTFIAPDAGMAICIQYGGCHGPWANVMNRYLGLKFITNGKTRYGWARLSVQGSIGVVATLTGYAYETIAGQSIKAGQTKEADDPNDEGFGAGASVTSPIPDAPEVASLGMLALGAQGVPLWRRKESIGAASENNSVSAFQ
jgi:hypothetical protein